MAPARPTRVLLIRTGAMGDILHALPAVTALRRARPDWHLAWAVEPHWAPLLPEHLIDTIHLVPTKAWSRRPLSFATLQSIAALRTTLRAAQYDLAVDLQGSIRSAVLGRLAAAPDLFGPAAPREKPARLLYSARISFTQPHVIAHAVELLSAATATPLAPAAITLPPVPVAQTWFESQIRDPGYILLCPTAGWPAKQWPADRYTLLTHRLRSQGHRVLTNSGPDGKPVCTVQQLIALTTHAALVVGGDTGPIHLAAALGIPTLALFGPTDPARNGPFFPNAITRVLRSPLSRTDHRRHPETDLGLLEISVDHVLDAAQSLLHSQQTQKEAPLHA